MERAPSSCSKASRLTRAERLKCWRIGSVEGSAPVAARSTTMTCALPMLMRREHMLSATSTPAWKESGSIGSMQSASCCSEHSIATLRRPFSPQAVKKRALWRSPFLDIPNAFIPQVNADGIAGHQLPYVDRRVDDPLSAFPGHWIENG